MGRGPAARVLRRAEDLQLGRPTRSLALSFDLPPDTYRVSALAGEVQALLQGTYPSVWVVGEIQRLNRARSGHAYFDLVEKGDDHQVVGRLSAVAGCRRKQSR